MSRTEMLREVRMKRFEEVYDRWRRRRITQALAANVLGVTARTFRRWVVRYEAGGLAALKDKRVAGPAHRRAPPEEVAALEALYRDGYGGWNVRHFHEEVYVREHGGSRSYTWVKNRLQEAGLVKQGRRKCPHRERRERKPASGMMLHQDASTHEWVGGEWWDLVVTNGRRHRGEVLSGFFVEEEGTWSSLRGVGETVEAKGLFDSLYTGLALLAHAEGGREGGQGQADPVRPGDGRSGGPEMIAGYSPQARGRSERFFATLQGRLPRELARAGITEMEEANEFLKGGFRLRFNGSFAVSPKEAKSAFSPLLPSLKAKLPGILCLREERTVGNDNCVSYHGKRLQIPPRPHRCHYVRAKVRVHEYEDGATAIFHGTRRLARYNANGRLLDRAEAAA